jgi:hypothetical protein
MIPIQKTLRRDGILDPEGRYKNPFTKESYSDTYKKEAIRYEKGENKGWSGYRTWQDRYEIFDKIHRNQVILIIAPTGVGKTVVVPKLLLHYFDYKKPVICTVPRQKVALESAEYAGFCMDVPIAIRDKKTNKITWARNKDFYVGYKFGDMLEPKSDKATKLLFSTDGLIKVMMTKSDPDLKEYGGIVIDEAHERSVSIDILIGLVAQLCKRRPDFKVIIMSATVSSATFINYFKFLGLEKIFTVYEPHGVPGNFNKTLTYAPDYTTEDKTIKKMMVQIDELLCNNEIMDVLMSPDNVNDEGTRFFKYGRDILGFVASGSEGMKIKKHLDAQLAKNKYKYKPFIMVFTKDTDDYTNDVALKADGLIFANTEPGSPGDYQLKIILSTPVAESSITFKDPLAYVFDSGRNYFVDFDPNLYGIKQYKRYVTRANIIQRCGRTGRTNDGNCIFMYSEDQYNNEFKAYQDAEILTNDISDDLLGICLLPSVRTIDRTLTFLKKLIEPLENYERNIIVGFRNLLEYDCIDDNGNVSQFAGICGAFGKYNYNIVRLICIGYYTGALLESIYLAAILANIKSFVDMFKIPVGMEEDPVLMAKFMGIFKQFAHPMGEHLSLLNLFMEWAKVPQHKKRTWEQTYSIHGGRMYKIDLSIKALTKIVLRNMDDIKKLNLIKVYLPERKAVPATGLVGGSVGHWNDHSSILELSGLSHASDLSINFPSRDFFTLGSSVAKPGCVGAFNSMIAGKCDLHRNRGSSVFALGGGGETNPAVDRDDEPVKKIPLVQAMSPGARKLKAFIEDKDFSMRGMFLNTQKGMPVDLGPVQSWSLDERIMLCVYFAYCTHVAMYEGESNKYVVKYSPAMASIEKSVLDTVIKIKPNFLVYHEFSLNEERGNTLSIASHLPHKIINVFMQKRPNQTRK